MEEKQLELLSLEEDDEDLLGEDFKSLPKDSKEVFIQKQIELLDEKIIKSKMSNLVQIGTWVERKEYAAEIPAVLGLIFSAYQEKLESSPNGQIRELLSQFYNGWISKAIEKIEAYKQERDKENE